MYTLITRQTMLLMVVTILSLTSLILTYNRIPRSVSSKLKLKTSLSLTSTSSSSAFQSETTPGLHGLLAGFNRQSNITAFAEMYYTDQLNFVTCKEEFYKDNILWRSFMQDIKPDESPAQVIECISNAAEEFINSDEVYDRGEIMKSLMFVKKGDMVILTGGPSTGKSLVVKRLFGNDSKYLYLDGRKTGPNIVKAVANNLIKRDKIRSLTVESMQKMAPLLISSLGSIIGNESITQFKIIPEVLIKIMEVVTKSPDLALDSLEAILELMSILQTPIEGIIFDEANEYFTAESLPLLKCLTSLTKQDRSLSVIMATSDYGFPFALNELGYNKNHISISLVLSDVSPSDTLHLLSSWGVRPSLAYLLVDIYGGHILQISRALVDLHLYKEDAEINRSFIEGLGDQLIACINNSKEKGIEKKVMAALYTLMQTGFFACNFDDPVADLITKHNIAGFIGDRAVVPGLSKKVRRNQSGLIPSSQMIRTVYSLKVIATKQDE